MHIMKITISLFILFISLSAFSQSEKLPFHPGEKLVYSAHYHWGLLWMEAGEVEFTVDTVHYKNAIVLKMQSIGRTLPKYDWLFKVRDTFASEAIYPEMKPIVFKRSNYEGNDWVRNFYSFNWKNNRVVRDMESKLTKRKIDTIALPKESVMDIQTAVYYARLWDLQNAKIGEQRIIKVILAGDFFTIPMTYQGKETVKHKNGKNYSCYKITTKVVEGLIFKANQEISIYVSTDENKLPLVVKAPILIGRVESYLQQTKGVNFPKSIPD